MVKEFLYNYGLMLLSFLLSFYIPVIPLLVLIIIITGTDMITAYIRDSKRYRKLQTITSSKLRKTSIKTAAYLIVMLLVYAICHYSFGIDIALYLTRFTFFAFASNELFSIGENLNLITGDNIFLSTIRNIVRKSTSWINDKMEDHEKNKEQI